MIAYELGENLYLNITNRCTNDCSFCVRNLGPGVGGHDLWLKREPLAQEVIDAVNAMGKAPSEYEEVVFCGYGEPMMRLDAVIEVARYLKDHGAKVRIDTNGQANLIYGENVVPRLKGLVDTISISLNTENAEKYDKLCRPNFGSLAYDKMLEFAAECVKYIPRVILSVVDIPGIDIDKCRDIAQGLGTELRIRTYVGK
jgi:TatD family-associated radical SAM protein